MSTFTTLWMGQASTSGSGGDPSVTVEPLIATENKEYIAPSGVAYSPVTVNVPTGSAKPNYLISDGDNVSTFYFNTAYALGTWLATLTYSDLDPNTGLYVCYTGLGYFFGVDLTSGQYALVWNDGVNIVPIYSTVAVPAFSVNEAGWQMALYAPSSSVTVDQDAMISALWTVLDDVIAKGSIAFGVNNSSEPFYLTFSSDSAFTLATNNSAKNWDGTLYYSTNKTDWNIWNGATTLSSGSTNALYLCGTGNTLITGSSSTPYHMFKITGTNVRCDGNILNLLDYSVVLRGEYPTMAPYAFYRLFQNCTCLITAPTLPATTLANYCYNIMFSGCTGLTTAPALPATTLANSCYASMFFGCTGLTTAPILPATTLADSCYNAMFQNCTGLTTAPVLPATTLANRCYGVMFANCTGLTTAPALPATTLADSCYASMFSGCSGLTTAPALPATTLANFCYYTMFANCTNLKISETSSALYQYEYRIPTSGTGTTVGSQNLTYMFSNTGGSFTGTPTINKTYYTDHPLVA